MILLKTEKHISCTEVTFNVMILQVFSMSQVLQVVDVFEFPARARNKTCLKALRGCYRRHCLRFLLKYTDHSPAINKPIIIHHLWR